MLALARYVILNLLHGHSWAMLPTIARIEERMNIRIWAANTGSETDSRGIVHGRCHEGIRHSPTHALQHLSS